MSFGQRCHELFRHPDHTLLLCTTGDAGRALQIATEVEGRVRGYVVVPAGTTADLSGRILADGDGNFAAAYEFGESDATPAAWLVRPDGYVGYRSSAVDVDRLLAHLRLTMRVAH